MDEEAASLERMRQEILELKELISKRREAMDQGESDGDEDDVDDLKEILEMKMNGLMQEDTETQVVRK